MQEITSNSFFYKAVFIGAGASGFFSAIVSSESLNTGSSLLLLEQFRNPLSKLKVSGGGRCNVTHACFNPKDLIRFYPRGNKELLSTFFSFQPQDMVNWFKKEHVTLKTEDDGRMFPITDSSQTIIDCFLKVAERYHLNIQYQSRVKKVVKEKQLFTITLSSGDTITTPLLFMGTGSSKEGLHIAKELGHSATSPVPSLFTFNLPDSPLSSLSGVSLDRVKVTLPAFKKSEIGPLLITHWGFSGPAILKLSSLSARELYAVNYHTPCYIDWVPNESRESIDNYFNTLRKDTPQKKLSVTNVFSIPRKLWITFLNISNIPISMTWNQLSKKQSIQLTLMLKSNEFLIQGKTRYKKEFVTCGGIRLSEINFKTMESRLVPGLFFGGEVLDIDGVTGGFNFQAAWTTAWIAAQQISSQIKIQ